MCGLTGFMGLGALQDPLATLAAMGDAVRHRGPDSGGTWADPAQEIWLAHRRLAIVDLSAAGHQPMTSASGRYVLVFNGEIYNHLDLRAMLGSEQWAGHSDTETLLAAFERYGVERTLQLVQGMFAFAVWDRDRRELLLARDPFGEKPIYYGWQGPVFLFGSELGALRQHPDWVAEIDRGSLCLLLRYNCVPAPHSIFKGIAKLPPGTLLTVSNVQREPRLKRYYAGPEAVAAGRSRPFQGSPGEAVDELDGLLRAAVRRQMMADVPLGAFLSGGIDSSTIVALMQAQTRQPVRTFSIGFDIAGYDEAQHAKAVARHLGTSHTEMYVNASDAQAVIPKLAGIYSEPFADSSQIPTYLVSALARRHVTVSLSGDAGDELFAGYNRYLASERWTRRLAWVPSFARRMAARAIRSVSPATWDRLAGYGQAWVPARRRFRTPGDKLHKAAWVLETGFGREMYLRLTSHWENPAMVVLGGHEPPLLETTGSTPVLGDTEWMMAMDLQTYLPDDILVKVDRAAMAVSLESRVPFLDPAVVEFAWRLPLSYKVRDGQTKWVLRQVLDRYVPRHLIERPKMGFGVPIDSWLRGPLREWAEDLLDEALLRRQGFFAVELVRARWHEHLSGQRNWQYHLWDVLMFQSWLASFSGRKEGVR